MSILGQRPNPREKSLLSRGEEKPFLGHGESPPRHSETKDRGDNLPPVVTLPIIPWSRKSTTTEKDNESLQRKGCHHRIQCLAPNTTILLCPYNHSQQLEGRADGTNTYPRDPIQEEENHYKKGWRETEGGGVKTLQHGKGTRKGSWNSVEDQSPQTKLNPSHLDQVKHRANFCSYTKA